MGFDIPASTTHFIKKNFSDKIALIDADRYKHLAVYRAFQRINDGEPHSRKMIEEIVDDYLYNDIFSKFSAKAYVFCFSAPSKQIFRNAVAQEKKYKGKRADKVDLYDYPQKWDDMAHAYEYIYQNHSTLIFSDLEADDLLSMLQHPTDTFIFSHDKDLKQVVGFHYDMQQQLLMYTDEKEGFELLATQILTGDTVDNIPGLKGFGEKALEKFREETFHYDDEQLIIATIKKFTDKLGMLHGMDTFSEMWQLVSMRLNRGNYAKEKYQKAFLLIEGLLSDGKDATNDSSQSTRVLS